MDHLFDLHGPRFIETPRTLSDDTAVAIFGVPFDGTTSFRPGTRSGPDALRAASLGLETYSPEQDLDLTDYALADLGNLDVPHGAAGPVVARIHEATVAILGRGAKPLMLGGEHSLTPGAARAVFEAHPEVVVVQFDAHADLRDGYLGDHHSHASAMRRCLDFLAPDAMLQVGIRSGTREEFQEMRDTGRLIAPRAEALRDALTRFAGRPIYLTIDLDVFDPASFPGTGTPEPGGVDWPTFMALLNTLSTFNLVGADVVELSPALDPTGCSSVLAAKVVREVLLQLAR